MLRFVLNTFKKIIVVLVLILSNCLTVRASNYHEHFETLPLASHIADNVFNDLIKLPEDDQKLNQLFPNFEYYFLPLVAYATRLSESEIISIVNVEQFKTKTLKGLFDSLASRRLNPEQVLRRMLEFDDNLARGYRENRIIYRCISAFRRALLIALPIETVTRVFATYFSHDPLENRDVIYLTTPAQFFAPNHVSKLYAIKRIANQYGSKILFFKSITRSRLREKNSIDFSDDLKPLISSGLLSGLDITGSIDEDVSTNIEATLANNDFENKYVDSLVKIADLCVQNNLLLRIHSFEGINSGAFYRALKRFLSDYNKPLKLHIGHINHITTDWLDILRSNTNLTVSFDVNIVSLLTLQDSTTVQGILAKVELIKKYGFNLSLGSDGRGVFKHSSSHDQQVLADALPKLGAPCIRILRNGSRQPREVRSKTLSNPDWVNSYLSH